MSKAIVRHGQSLLDIAIQYTGSEESLAELARLNNLNITATLTPGAEVELPAVIDKRVVKIFKDGGFMPASDTGSGSITVTMPKIRYVIKTSAANEAIVKPGQSLLDIAIQYLGSEEGLVSLVQLNNLSVNSSLVAGTALKLPAIIDRSVVDYFKAGGYVPAAEISETETLEGIDYWGIEVDFIVQ